MGNRAVITTKEKRVGIYVHWNGGRESIEGFLKAARELGYRTPESDPFYAMGRLTGAICAFIGMCDPLSVGIGALEDLDCDNGDNGVYVIGDDWKVVERYGSGARGRCLEDPDEEAFDRETADRIAEAVVAACRRADAEPEEAKE